VGETTKIEWAHHTFNPWIGCTRVSPACDHCYAADLARRYSWAKWGPGEPRRFAAASTWKHPRKWDREAKAAGVRRRVFCASLADVFDAEVDDEWRVSLIEEILATPNLDWLLLTKRPQVAKKFFDDIVPRNRRISSSNGEASRRSMTATATIPTGDAATKSNAARPTGNG
jgi:protein gp37